VIYLGSPTLVGGNTTIQIVARGGNDNIVGGDNIENISGGDDNDNLSGLGGNDFLYGEMGSDILNGGSGSDIINGGLSNDVGSDTAVYRDNTGAVIIDLAGGYTLETSLTTGTINFSATTISTDQLDSIEDAVGSEFGDRIYATDGSNNLTGGGGDDIIYALDGNDRFYGDAGSDFLIGGNGTDALDYRNATGAVFADISYFVMETGLTTGTVSSTTASPSTDYVISIEDFYGSNFGDRIYGSDSNNLIFDGGGNDIVYAGGGDDLVLAGAGSDIFIGGDGIDILNYLNSLGAIFADLSGSITETTFAGGSGTVNAATTAVSIDYAIEFENLIGSRYGDRLYGSASQNSLYGDDGDDIIYGGDGADSLFGNDGNDWLIGEAGADTLTGGRDADRFYISGTFGAGQIDTITDFRSGEDQIYISRAALGLSATDSWNFVADGPAVAPNTIIFTSGINTFSFDADGSGPGAAINIALWLGGGFSPVVSDIILY
jgi:Ca2+-binding RTX toxin-like protein